jgi:oligopeptidase B
MQLWTLPVGQESDENWTLVQDSPTSFTWLDKIAIEEISVFRYHIVLEGRYEGIKDIWILTVDPDDTSRISNMERVEFPLEQAHTAELAANLDYNTTEIIIDFVSMVTPAQQIQIDLFHPNSDDRLVIYETPVPGYQKDEYQCSRIQVPSRDGQTQIPVSLVYQVSTWTKRNERGEPVPIHLYAYGAYGASMDDHFSTTRLPLLDRGMIFAVAHVRGGGEMGRNWYTDGKLLKKHNTFDDFVDVGRYFVDEHWTTSDTLSCEGRSAGGLTMGASLNQAPDLFRAAILGVPFVDLVVTMSDASIPLVRAFVGTDFRVVVDYRSLLTNTAFVDHWGMERVGKSKRS